jgi:hypothetical protein
MESHNKDNSTARVGDWLEVAGVAGSPPRRGEISEILGVPGHTHFRVRWDEGHESLVYPADHEAIVHHAANRGDRSA